MQSVSFRLPDELLARLTKVARARHTTKSCVVREMLEKELFVQEGTANVSCYDLARDLAGSVKGLPNDLSTNPRYMEGLGQ